MSLAIAKVAGNLALASSVTLGLLFGIVFATLLVLVLIVNAPSPLVGLAIALPLTLIFNLLVFFVAPILMDLMQGWLYNTRWVSMAEIERRSPESAHVIRRVCAKHKISEPKLGLIADQNPTAFTYGSLPNTARLVVSEGLFKYLDDDEAATVYAHELGHIVHWDFAVMTLASTMVQVVYLIYITIRELGARSEKAKDYTGYVALVAYIFYIVGTYLLLYLSRTREYFADHFAAEVTGNPNGLSRALVKIAFGIVEESREAAQPSRLLEGTRALGIYDANAANGTGTAYRISSSPEKVGRIFLWDMFNPWAKLMELNSTHPLTGKRVRALSTYAEQLGLDQEFDMGRVAAEGRRLDQKRLYGSFLQDAAIYWAEWLTFTIGWLVVGATRSLPLIGLPFILAGIAVLVKRLFMFPDANLARESDVLTLMGDPYASPLRGQPVQLRGQVIGRGDAGYVAGSDLKLQDASGMLFLRYSSRWGPIGNFFFGASQAETLVGAEVAVRGWFRRGIASYLDLLVATPASGKMVTSYPAFWQLVLGIFWIGVGIALTVFIQSILIRARVGF
jgi:Zn-dependent protease with chaperone function